MTNSKFIFASLLFVVFLFSCGEKSTTQKEGMTEFSKEDEFKKAHELPFDLPEYEPYGSILKIPVENGEHTSIYGVRQRKKNNKYLFVLHEWWGLNDHIKKEVERLFEELDQQVTVLALDLYDGKVAESRDDAGALMEAAKDERLEAIVDAVIKRMTKDSEIQGTKPQIATIGWCFGGGWSLKTSIMAGDAGVGCVMYYGMPVKTAQELAPLKADVLNIHPKQDKWITEGVINEFKTLAKATGKNLTVHQYDADHAFANPSSPRYNEAAAQEANAKVLAFLKEKLNI